MCNRLRSAPECWRLSMRLASCELLCSFTYVFLECLLNSQHRAGCFGEKRKWKLGENWINPGKKRCFVKAKSRENGWSKKGWYSGTNVPEEGEKFENSYAGEKNIFFLYLFKWGGPGLTREKHIPLFNRSFLLHWSLDEEMKNWRSG